MAPTTSPPAPSPDSLRPGRPGADSVRVGLLALLPVAFLSVFLALGAGGADGEGEPDGRDGATASFEAVFHREGRLTLEEPDSALVASVAGVDARDDGVVAVADHQQDRVRVYAPDGRLLADLGGSGAGPGELDVPLDVAFDDRGGLYVAQGGAPRVTRFDGAFAYDTAFRVDSAYSSSAIAFEGGHAVVFASRPGTGAVSIRFYDADGRVRTSFHPRREAYGTVPYWNAVAGRRVAVSASHVVAGGSLLYPFPRYGPDATLRDSIGTPPDSWVAPPRPERGAFTSPNQRKQFEKWRRTFTTVDELAIYRDSLLVVAHEELDPEILAYEEATYRADVYRIETGRKLLEDVPLPGRLLDGGRYLHLLLSSPPQPWVLGRFRLTTEGVSR